MIGPLYQFKIDQKFHPSVVEVKMLPEITLDEYTYMTERLKSGGAALSICDDYELYISDENGQTVVRLIENPPTL